MKSYILLTAMDPHELVNLVNIAMRDGWDLWGQTTTPVITQSDSSYIVYTQGMIRDDGLIEQRLQKDVTAT